MNTNSSNRTKLSTDQLQFIEAKVSNEKKSVGLAYLLWFFLGLWGIHNFYLAKPKLAVFQLAGGIVSVVVLIVAAEGFDKGNPDMGASFAITAAAVVLVIWAVSFIADMFLIPRRARQFSERLRRQYAADIAPLNTA